MKRDRDKMLSESQQKNINITRNSLNYHPSGKIYMGELLKLSTGYDADWHFARKA